MSIGELTIRSIENISVIYFVISLTFYLVDGKKLLTVDSDRWKRILFGIIFGTISELVVYTSIYIGNSSLTYSFIPIFICFYIAGPLGGTTSFVVMYLLMAFFSEGWSFNWVSLLYYMSLILYMSAIKCWKNNSSKQFSIHLLVMIIYSTCILNLYYPGIWKSMDVLLFQLFCYVSSVFCYYFVNQQRLYFSSHVELIEKSKKDFLTKLYNRNAMVETLTKWDFKKKKYGVLLLDIDYFKSINDCYGHLAGDQVLKQFSHLLETSVEKNVRCFRYGGEEFLILVKNSSLEDVFEIAEKIRQLVMEHSFVLTNDEHIHITTSIGVAVKTNQAQGYLEVIENADKALYQAKNSGRNQSKAIGYEKEDNNSYF